MDEAKRPLPTWEELMQAVKHTPPNHTLIFTANYHLMYVKKSRPWKFGEPCDGTLFNPEAHEDQ